MAVPAWQADNRVAPVAEGGTSGAGMFDAAAEVGGYSGTVPGPQVGSILPPAQGTALAQATPLSVTRQAANEYGAAQDAQARGSVLADAARAGGASMGDVMGYQQRVDADRIAAADRVQGKSRQATQDAAQFLRDEFEAKKQQWQIEDRPRAVARETRQDDAAVKAATRADSILLPEQVEQAAVVRKVLVRRGKLDPKTGYVTIGEFSPDEVPPRESGWLPMEEVDAESKRIERAKELRSLEKRAETARRAIPPTTKPVKFDRELWVKLEEPAEEALREFIESQPLGDYGATDWTGRRTVKTRKYVDKPEVWGPGGREKWLDAWKRARYIELKQENPWPKQDAGAGAPVVQDEPKVTTRIRYDATGKRVE